MKDSKTEIGDFLRNYRKVHDDMTLRQLSEKTGISYSHLSKIERGEHIPSKPTLKILASGLDLNLDKLYLMSGYAPEVSIKQQVGRVQRENENPRKSIIEKISNEFPDADLMFKDMANMTTEQLEDVYDFIKYKKSQNKDKK